MNIKLTLIALTVAGACFVTWHYVHTINENKRLTELLKAEKQTIQKLDRKAVSEKNITENESNILEGVRDAPESHNAPVAPVLDDTIDRIDGLHNATSN